VILGLGVVIMVFAAVFPLVRSWMEYNVSVHPRPWPEPALEVARAIAVMYRGRGREVPLAVAVREELGELFADEEFTAGFGVEGRPGWSPGRLALVTVLQRVENLTDRQAADAVCRDLTWKYALGLGLEDAGFHHSVLSEFRARVIAGGLEMRVLDLLLDALSVRGLVKAGGAQRTDSTHVVSAVRDLNRLELAGESVRACLEALSAVAPGWVREVLEVPGWASRYRARVDSWRLPTSKAKRDQLAVEYGSDGIVLVQAVYAPFSPPWLRELPAVQALRVMLVQNYITVTDPKGREVVRRRESHSNGGEGIPPASIRLTSPYDTDARWAAKGDDLYWNGYKVHITETCDTPQAGPGTAPGEQGQDADATADATAGGLNIITHVATTDATVPDAKMTDPIHQALKARGLTPGEHFVDSGYPSAALVVQAARKYGIALVSPLLADTSAQARAAAGYSRADFVIDFDAQQATCPSGQTSTWWSPARQRGTDAIVVKFAATTCTPCPVRDHCTRSTSTRHGRQITVPPREIHQAQQAARAAETTKTWQDRYAIRAGVEGTIRQAIAAAGIRRARYRGLPKVHLEHIYAATALNLIRLHAWWNGHPLDRTRTSHLARLDHTLAA
jgi:transposase